MHAAVATPGQVIACYGSTDHFAREDQGNLYARHNILPRMLLSRSISSSFSARFGAREVMRATLQATACRPPPLFWQFAFELITERFYAYNNTRAVSLRHWLGCFLLQYAGMLSCLII
jgi:hypothetical protein